MSFGFLWIVLFLLSHACIRMIKIPEVLEKHFKYLIMDIGLSCCFLIALLRYN